MATGFAVPSARAAGWQVTPQLSLSETYADIVKSSSPSLLTELPQSGWVTNLAPSIRVAGSGARIKGFFDYSLDRLTYANQSRFNNTQKALNSLVSVEAIEQWLFLDVRASVSQQARSVFSTSATDLASPRANRTEATVYQMSPYIRGKFSDIAAYQLRLNATNGHSSDGTLADTRTTELIGRIRNASSSAKLGWSIDGSSLSVHNGAVGKRQDDRIRGSLIYEVAPLLHVSLGSGRETTDYAGSAKRSLNTPTVGVDWSPSGRTQVAAVEEKRFFGTGHSLVISHRTPLTAWKYTDDKDVSILPNLLAATGQGAVYGLMSDLLASSIPDPVARSEAVRSRLESTGNLPYGAAGTGILTSRIVLSRNREASVALVGVTNLATLTLSQSDEQGLGTSLGLADSFSLSNKIRVQSLNAAWVHKLTPLSSMTLAAFRSRNDSLSAANLQSEQRSISALFSTQLGPKTAASIGVRRVLFDSTTTGGHRENALVLSLVQRF